MTVPELQAEIILRTKQIDICDTLHDAQNATTEDELIKAGLPLVVFTYQAGIVDDALLAEFSSEAALNANGIYTTGTFAVTNPVDELFDVYIMKEAIVTVNIDGNENCKINVMGGGQLILVASGKSYATVKAYDNSSLDITINDEAMVNLETRDTTTSTITQNNNSVLQLTGQGNSTVTHFGNDTAYGLAKVTQKAKLTYTVTGTAQMVVTSYNSSQVFLT